MTGARCATGLIPMAGYPMMPTARMNQRECRCAWRWKTFEDLVFFRVHGRATDIGKNRKHLGMCRWRRAPSKRWAAAGLASSCMDVDWDAMTVAAVERRPARQGQIKRAPARRPIREPLLSATNF